MQWWAHFLKFWPPIVTVFAILAGAWGMIIDAKWERKELRIMIQTLAKDKGGNKEQWQQIKQLQGDVKNIEGREHLRDYRIRQLEDDDDRDPR